MKAITFNTDYSTARPYSVNSGNITIHSSVWANYIPENRRLLLLFQSNEVCKSDNTLFLAYLNFCKGETYTFGAHNERRIITNVITKLMSRMA